MQLLHQTLTKDNKDFANKPSPTLFPYTPKVRHSAKDVARRQAGPMDRETPSLNKSGPKLL